jgi:hypothetical protein
MGRVEELKRRGVEKMIVSILPLPEEPRSLQAIVRTLLEQAPDEGLPLVLAGDWIADPLWGHWGETLARRGMDRAQFGEIVAGYANELRLWVVGERPWEQAAGGLAGRVARRLDPSPAARNGNGSAGHWREALGRVGVAPDAEMSALVARIGELQLHYDVTAPGGRSRKSRAIGAASAIVWAGAPLRDPEVPFGEAKSGASGAAALAEALGRFLLKDPAYPPR